MPGDSRLHADGAHIPPESHSVQRQITDRGANHEDPDRSRDTTDLGTGNDVKNWRVGARRKVDRLPAVGREPLDALPDEQDTERTLEHFPFRLNRRGIPESAWF